MSKPTIPQFDDILSFFYQIEINPISGIPRKYRFPFRLGTETTPMFLVITQKQLHDDITAMCAKFKDVSTNIDYYGIFVSEKINNPSALGSLKAAIAHEYMHIIDHYFSKIFEIPVTNSLGYIRPCPDQKEVIHMLMESELFSEDQMPPSLVYFSNFMHIDSDMFGLNLLVADSVIDDIWQVQIIDKLVMAADGSVIWKDQKAKSQLSDYIIRIARQTHVPFQQIYKKLALTQSEMIKKYASRIELMF